MWRAPGVSDPAYDMIQPVQREPAVLATHLEVRRRHIAIAGSSLRTGVAGRNRDQEQGAWDGSHGLSEGLREGELGLEGPGREVLPPYS